MDFVFQNSPNAIQMFLQTVYSAPIPNICSIYVTGGASQLLSHVFTVPGASRSIMEAAVPYNRAALSSLLRRNNDQQCCNSETALLMADTARKNSAEVLLRDTMNLADLARSNIFGLSVTAALVTATPKKGAHRCFVGCRTMTGGFLLSLELEKGLRTRLEEDFVCSRLALDAMARACHILEIPVDYLRPSDDGTLNFRVNIHFRIIYPQNFRRSCRSGPL